MSEENLGLLTDLTDKRMTDLYNVTDLNYNLLSDLISCTSVGEGRVFTYH